MTAAVHSDILVLAGAISTKVPFYVCGGLLAIWAVVLSSIGLSRPEFPGGAAGARVVMGISAVLVLGTMSMAVLTATSHHGEAKAETKPPGPQPSGGGATVKVTADPTGQLKYQQTSLTAKAGSVTIDFDNPSPLTHDVTIAGSSGGKLGATKQIANGKTTAKVTLKAGTYTFYCSVDGHRAAGMKGTLTVG